MWNSINFGEKYPEKALFKKAEKLLTGKNYQNKIFVVISYLIMPKAVNHSGI